MGHECLGFVDGGAIVLERGGEARRVGGRKESATAVARSTKPDIGEPARGFHQSHGTYLMAPGAEGRDAAPGARLDDVEQSELLPHGRRVDREVCEVA
jgi:hypothetical protein